MSIARFSFKQLRELGHCGENEKAHFEMAARGIRTRAYSIESPSLYRFTTMINVKDAALLMIFPSTGPRLVYRKGLTWASCCIPATVSLSSSDSQDTTWQERETHVTYIPPLRGGAGRKTVLLILQPTHFIVHLLWSVWKNMEKKTK